MGWRMYLQCSGVRVVAIIKSSKHLVHYASEVVICAAEDRERCMVFSKAIRKGKHVTCGQVWCPLLGICALHFTHPNEHTQQWVANTHTHTHMEQWGLVPCSRVSPQMWYWGWKKALVIHSPHPQFWDSSQKFQMCLEVTGFAVIYC